MRHGRNRRAKRRARPDWILLAIAMECFPGDPAIPLRREVLPPVRRTMRRSMSAALGNAGLLAALVAACAAWLWHLGVLG